MNNKNIYLFLLIIILELALISFGMSSQKAKTVGFAGYNTNPSFTVASSTAFSLTTSSKQLLATSTPTRRFSAIIQPINCTTAGAIFLGMNGDAPAVSNTGTAVYATSTMQLSDFGATPIVQGSVQGIAPNGTCTVLVTEWRSQY